MTLPRAVKTLKVACLKTRTIHVKAQRKMSFQFSFVTTKITSERTEPTEYYL